MKLLFQALAASCLCFVLSMPLHCAEHKFLKNPSLGKKLIAFDYGNQLWIVSRTGGVARQLTTGNTASTHPFISPDDKWIAYTGRGNGISNVYLISTEGGTPKQLTFSSAGPEEVVGWTWDGRVLFRAPANGPFWPTRLFTISIDGGLPQQLPFPEGVMGAFSPDGKKIAYVPVWSWSTDRSWKGYRGGRTARIWIARLSDSDIKQIPSEGSNDFDPMWIGDKIYFLSDRQGAVTLFSYDLKSSRIEQLLPASEPDVQWATASGGTIIYEQIGKLRQFPIADHRQADLPVQLTSDLPELRTRVVTVGDHIASYDLSPTGSHAVFEAHGEIFLVPADQGEAQNLTHTSGVAERDPAWSPDGRWIAYFSDESGEYALHLHSSDGPEVRKIGLGNPPSFFYSPQWSPDGRFISYVDARLNLWYADTQTGALKKIDTDYYVSPFRNFDVAWSPDSAWIAYTRQLPSRMHALFLFSLSSGKTTQVTDGLSDVRYPVFDHGGNYLYFTSSVDTARTAGWLDLSSYGKPATRNVYALLLHKGLHSPLGEEPASKTHAGPSLPPHGGQNSAGGKEADSTAKPPENLAKARFIDVDDAIHRIVSLPIAARNLTGLQAGTPGVLYLVETNSGPGSPGGLQTVYQFDLGSRRLARILENARAFQVSFDGKAAAYALRGNPLKWNIGTFSATKPPTGEMLQGKVLKTEEMKINLIPLEEWKQIYHEAWRIQRDFFYDSHLHGVDWRSLEKKYEPYLDALSCREDLNYLLIEIFGQLGSSHIALEGFEQQPSPDFASGFLGADYVIENGRYRIKTIYKRSLWDFDSQAPLDLPWLNVKEGDYVLAVQGHDLHKTDSIFKYLRGTAGKPVRLSVSSDPEGKSAHDVNVVPIWSEGPLRAAAWIESNLSRVRELSGGRIGYIPVPDTRAEGYRFFNKYFFAQLGVEAFIVDDRFNHGGLAPDYMVNALSNPVLNHWHTREGHHFTTPFDANSGPVALLINMYSGSGGDALAWYFQHKKLGPLVGTRTWGGISGTYDYPKFIDGTALSTAQLAPYDDQGHMIIENKGVSPDLLVEEFPAEWRRGQDAQLEGAVKILLKRLKSSSSPERKTLQPPSLTHSSSPGSDFKHPR
jgi:tricorn protease